MSAARSAVGLVVCVALCFGAAYAGSALTRTSVGGWYVALAKPSWSPPDWVFGVVWTILFLAMAVAAWLVWRTPREGGSWGALGLFAIQLGLNVGWSACFFFLRSPGLALLEIGLLWIAILGTTVAFFRVALAAGWLMVPYLLWVTFAAILNGAIWRLNP